MGLLAPFRERDFTLLYVTNFFELFATTLSRLSALQWLYEATGDGRALGMIGAVTLVCQIAGYSQSLAEWVDYFGQCGSAQNPCVWDKDTAYARVGVSLALFTLFNTANLIFSILFAIRSRAGDTDTLIPGRSTPSTASLVKE